jgi:cyanophycinase
MGRLFLFGDVADNFEAVSTAFVEAAGGRSARIALLLAGGPDWERYVPRYRDPWMRLGAAEVIPIAPLGEDLRLDVSQIAQLERCSGVFIGGGDTRRYHKIYALSELGAIIRELYRSGIPYGGVSAGALIPTEKCTIWGSKVITPTNEYFVRAKAYHDLAKDGDVHLTVGRGLGLLQGCLIEVHFSEFGGFPRLVQAMEQTESTFGFGIDEPICLEIRDRVYAKVHGRGRAYFLRRTGPLLFEVRVLEPGDEIEMHRE